MNNRPDISNPADLYNQYQINWTKDKVRIDWVNNLIKWVRNKKLWIDSYNKKISPESMLRAELIIFYETIDEIHEVLNRMDIKLSRTATSQFPRLTFEYERTTIGNLSPTDHSIKQVGNIFFTFYEVHTNLELGLTVSKLLFDLMESLKAQIPVEYTLPSVD